MRLSGPGGRWQVSTQGGGHPSWNPDGTEIFYIAPPEDRLMSVAVKLGDGFEAGLPELLFEAPLRQGYGYPYTVAPDGRRFVLNLRPEAVAAVEPFTLIQNWHPGL